VETVARGLPPNGIHFLVTGVRLLPFDCDAHAHSKTLWPPPTNHHVTLPPATLAGSTARGAEIRRIGEVVAARKREDADTLAGSSL
jgi:hypothetical protein